MKILGTQSLRPRPRSPLCAIALTALIGFAMASCVSVGGGSGSSGGTSGGGSTTATLSGTYVADTNEINTSFTFSGSNLTVQVDDRIGPGTYSISGDILSLNISGLTETFTFTIVDEHTLKASSGIYWRKQ